MAGTEAGDLVVFFSGDYLCHLPCSPGADMPIVSLVSIKQGFIVGSRPGVFLFMFYDQSKGGPSNFASHFYLAHTLQSELTGGSISSMTLSPDEDTCCALTSDNQMLHVPLQAPLSLGHFFFSTFRLLMYSVSFFK